ncbi:MAG TPA: NHLP bacteriocin system secretion protein [Thermoanaerobaculia bacterium]|jgi:HlyD family secretion protein|nr:NHLP bacteriocin system secretion protein [Thermoanaerobaculia bacterium]
MSTKIFRQVSLERLSSPEQLDQLMQVTTPKGWLALTALGALLLVALGWGIFGAIPTTAAGEGILLRRGGVSNLVATANGQVEEVLVRVGDVIQKGQVVARVRQQGLQRQIQDARSKEADLRREYDDLLRYAQEQRRLQARDLAQQRANLERSLEAIQKDLQLLEDRAKVEEDLLKDGLITKQQLLTTQQQLNQNRDKLASQRLEINGLELKRLEAEQQLDQQLEARQNAIRDLTLELREFQAKLAEDVRILSPHSGRVLELMATRGDLVTPGTPVLSLEVVSEDLVAVIFVPASEGKRVKPGMPVQVSPSTVKREEYGSMIGEVTWVSEFPSSERGMTRLLGNEALVTRLMQQGPPIQVNVALTRDPATPTGYRWSSSRGPSLEISSGTLAAGNIVVRRERPVSLLLPTLREKLGV